MPASNERPSRKRQIAPTSPEVVRGLPEACSPNTSATGRTTHEYGPSRMAPRKRSGSCSRVHASAALRCTDTASVRWDTMPATENPVPFSPWTDGSSSPYSVAMLGPEASCRVPCRSTCLMKTPLSTIALRGSPGSRSSATSRCPWITNSRSPPKPKLPITAGATSILFEPSRRRPTGPSSSSNSSCLATSASVESYGRRASASLDTRASMPRAQSAVSLGSRLDAFRMERTYIGPVDVLHESIDVRRRFRAMVHLIRMFVHVERQDRRAMREALCMVGGPLVQQDPVAMRIREQHPARAAAQRLAHPNEFLPPALYAAEVARQRRCQGALGHRAFPEVGEIKLVQDHRIRRDELLPLQAIDHKYGCARKVERVELSGNRAEPFHRSTVIVFVMTEDQLLGEPAQAFRVAGQRSHLKNHRGLLCLEQRVDHQPCNRGKSHDHRLRKFLHLPDQNDGDEHHQHRGQIDDGALSENDYGSCDRSDRCRRDTVDKGDDAGFLSVLSKVRRRNDREQIAWQKSCERRDHS